MALFVLKHSVFPNPNDVMISQKRVWSGLSKDLDALIDATFGYIPPAYKFVLPMKYNSVLKIILPFRHTLVIFLLTTSADN